MASHCNGRTSYDNRPRYWKSSHKKAVIEVVRNVMGEGAKRLVHHHCMSESNNVCLCGCKDLPQVFMKRFYFIFFLLVFWHQMKTFSEHVGWSLKQMASLGCYSWKIAIYKIRLYVHLHFIQCCFFSSGVLEYQTYNLPQNDM